MSAIPSEIESAGGSYDARAWTALAVLVAMSALSALDRQVIGLLVAPISADLGIGDFQISLLQGLAFALFYCVFGLPLGVLVDRWDRRKLIFIGITIWSLAQICCGLSRTFDQLAFCRFVVGAGEASLSPAAFSLLADLFCRNRLALALSIFALGSMVGGSSSWALAGWLVDALKNEQFSLPLVGVLQPWQLVFVITGAPGFFVALLIFMVREPTRMGRDQALKRWQLGAVFSYIRANAQFWAGLSVGIGMLALVSYGQAAWMAVILMRRFGWAVSKAGFVLSVNFVIFGFAGFLFCGWIADRWYRSGQMDSHMRYFAYAAPVAGILAIVGCMSPNPIVLLLCVGMAQALIAYMGVAAASIQIAVPNELRGQLTALYLFVMSLIGMGLGPSVVAGFTEYVFDDAASTHLSLAATYAIFTPLASLTLLFGMRQMRVAVARQDLLQR